MEQQEALAQASSPEERKFYEDFDEFASRLLAPKFYVELTSMYRYSKQYDDTWNTIWAEYDSFEERRIELGAKRLDWQDIAEQWRQGDEEGRKHYVPSLEEVYGKVPLSHALHTHLAVWESQVVEIDRMHSWKMALSDWARFQEVYHASEKFRAELSLIQQTSFRILDDWWNSRYSPPSDIEAFKREVEALATRASISPPTSSDFQHEWTSHSHYHTNCMELFFREFHAMEWETYLPKAYLLNLLACRTESARHAIHMRFAWATHRSIVLNDVRDQRNDLPEYIQPVRQMDQWKNNIFFQESQPGYASKQVQAMLLDLRTDPPLYLWDVKNKKTVRTNTFDQCPEYMCVSHTWGRWTFRPPQMVQVPNVPWEIKGNTLYNVLDVPDMLLGLNTDYVWLDLFCLPQNEGPEHHAEVANQTAIFRRSSACVAWLNDVEEWKVTRAALDNLGLRYLHKTCTHPDLAVGDDILDATFRVASARPELMKPDMNNEPSSWFSSLWTLQETVLCPNLRLCTRTMNVLSDGDRTPISLSTLLTLVDLPGIPTTIRTKEMILGMNGSPSGYKVPEASTLLHKLSLKTQLGWVLRLMTPIDIMINANLRACKRSRAVAIMSALDVLDWYKERKPDKDGTVSSTGYDDDVLILNTFPLSFIREAAAKFGSSFYTAISDVNAYRMEKFDTLTGFGGYQVGSMMPFTLNHGWNSSVYGAITLTPINSKDHESVATWVIQDNAAVRIRSAGILASSEDSDDLLKRDPIEALTTVMTSHTPEGSDRKKYEAKSETQTELRAKLKELAGKKSIYYALVLSDDFGLQFGLLMQTAKIRMPTPGVKKYLCKVGIFRTHQMVEKVPSTKVNWVAA